MTIQNKNIYAIIPSAGQGTRMASSKAKQYLPIGDKSIIEKTVSHFLDANIFERIIIPIAKDDNDIKEMGFYNNPKIKLIQGGNTRSHSVLNALQHVEGESIVMIHDAVRPYISAEEIIILKDRFIELQSEILIYGIPVYESLKMIDKQSLKVSKSVDRNNYYLAQTPQICRAETLKLALEACISDEYFPSDESEAIERSGGEIEFIPGNRNNIKITVQEDLRLHETSIIGNGFDSHRFKNGDGLMIGGIKVPFEKSFHAHSDGDIVIHALIDSMLSSLGLGDIGTNFPETPEWKDCPGNKMFNLSYDKVKSKGYKLAQFDVIVIAEEPKLSPFREEIIQNLCKITGLQKKMIGLKAKTSEKMGFIGKGEGAAALVISRLEK